jgi:hypothetical protein
MLLHFLPRNQENKESRDLSQFKISTPDNLSPREDNTDPSEG